jgi:hypothetical protein
MDIKEIVEMMDKIMGDLDEIPAFRSTLLDEALGDVWNAAEHARNLFADDDAVSVEMESIEE